MRLIRVEPQGVNRINEKREKHPVWINPEQVTTVLEAPDANTQEPWTCVTMACGNTFLFQCRVEEFMHSFETAIIKGTN